MHCPKNNLNLCIKTEPVTVEADTTVYVWFSSDHRNVNKRISCCICSSCDKLGFYAEIQIMFGTVCLSMILFDNLHIYIILLFVVENMHKSVPSQFYSIHTVQYIHRYVYKFSNEFYFCQFAMLQKPHYNLYIQYLQEVRLGIWEL